MYVASSTGVMSPAVVRAIHTDDPAGVYYTIRLEGGNERQTSADRLRPPSAPPWVTLAAVGITALSDALGVSAAPNLGGSDMRKLCQVINEPSSTEHLSCALRRLLTTKLTPELSRATGVDEAMVRLVDHESAEVRELSVRIMSAWSAQLEAERQRRELEAEGQRLASRPGPKPKGTGALGCRACQGAHRAHTCK